MESSVRAFGYVRVSNDEEAGNNASIAAQIEAIQAYAAREKVEIVQIFEELDVSGRKLQRKQFDRMIAQATSLARPVHQVITYNLSRFARRLLTQVVSEHRLEEAGVGLISLTEQFGNDANGKMMRSMIAVMNEKYALDASLFTRRDRRGNARKGFWNGGPVPFGYEARTVLVDGKKERRKLFLVEAEASVVRLIFDLAGGYNGQPMGTRAIAAHLNAIGYSFRGRAFFHSNVDGILTREHYRGSYLDRTANDQGITPSPEGAIVVPCPQIIDPGVIAGVAAKRAKAAPRVTPPRITNSPVLLTGIAHCGTADCGSGMTIRTGKGGRYAYYTCNAKATAGASRCEGKPVRQEELDGIVLDTLIDRVLAPERLKVLLATVLERSEEADTRRKTDLDRVRRERKGAEERLRRLWGMVESELESPSDPLFAAMVAERRQTIAALEASERSLVAQLAAGKRRIDEDTVTRFGDLMQARLTTGDPAFRKAYVRLFVSDVRVSSEQVAISGTRAALEAALIHGDRTSVPPVPSFDREWCQKRHRMYHLTMYIITTFLDANLKRPPKRPPPRPAHPNYF